MEEAYKDISKQRQKKSQIEKQKEAIEIVELIENEQHSNVMNSSEWEDVETGDDDSDKYSTDE